MPKVPSAFRVESELVRRGPDGSLAVYLITTTGAFSRCVDVPVETLTEAEVAAVVQSILTHLVQEIGPQLVRAVRSAQGGVATTPAGVTVQ